ncbi:hypothetical protein B0A55_12071 [Friedmanniomyces simplex]|uniref:Uncharacterized protein n=1 Tax=Friedmanniomyces simplex TaxID=329884 RepID=A0A4U0WKN5_9PEZI|nr:hypothetical protein B0A55_12071 [Friedmanniomyces simplex]
MAFQELLHALLLFLTTPKTALKALNNWLRSQARTISPPATSSFRSRASYTAAPSSSLRHGEPYTAPPPDQLLLTTTATAPRRCNILHGSCEVFVAETPTIGPTPFGPVYDFSPAYICLLALALLCALGYVLAALKQRYGALRQMCDELAAEKLAAVARCAELRAQIERRDERQDRLGRLYECSLIEIGTLDETISRAHDARDMALSARDAARAAIGAMETEHGAARDGFLAQIRERDAAISQANDTLAVVESALAGARARVGELEKREGGDQCDGHGPSGGEVESAILRDPSPLAVDHDLAHDASQEDSSLSKEPSSTPSDPPSPGSLASTNSIVPPPVSDGDSQDPAAQQPATTHKKTRRGGRNQRKPKITSTFYGPKALQDGEGV